MSHVFNMEQCSAIFRFTSVIVFCMPLLGACGALDKARKINDLAIEKAHKLNVDALVEAEVERQRFRRARCYSPLLNPAAIGAGAMDVRLGRSWIEELLRDCPQFSSLITQLVIENREQVAASWADNGEIEIAE